jgi:parallel beta-helix repeat protein
MKRIVSGFVLTLLLTGMLALAFNIRQVKASGTIYIRADGSIDPPDAPISTVDNVTYTLTGNITSEADGVVVERSNIVIDGNGYTLQGTGAYASKGIDLSSRSNITSKNTNIKDFSYGILLSESSNISITGNNITSNRWDGIRLESCSGCSIIENNVADNGYDLWDIGYGIFLNDCLNNTLSGNNVANNDYGIYLDFSPRNILRENVMVGNGYNFGVWADWENDVDSSNTVDGKAIYYWINTRDVTVPLEAGFVALVNCTNITVRDLSLTNNCYGILLVETTNSKIIQNNVTANYQKGIWLYESSNNLIVGNNVTNTDTGIWLYDSGYNTISGNKIASTINGIHLYSSFTSHNSVFGNNVAESTENGIKLEDARYNSIRENKITDNKWNGIYLSGSYYNSIVGNNVANNGYGIFLYSSSNYNMIYHNNFMDNSQQVWNNTVSMNVWDDGYPSGGNYWSDYNGTDSYRGAYQNETGSDGMGDTSYVIDADNQDRYPLMATSSMFDAGTWNGVAYNVNVVSNSTTSSFQLNPTQKIISFNVSGVEGTTGFCRITIPNIIVEDLWHGNYMVLLNGEPWSFRNWTDATSIYIYINYTHSEHEIVIIPEFPQAMILPVLMALATIVAIFTKRRFPRKLKT